MNSAKKELEKTNQELKSLIKEGQQVEKQIVPGKRGGWRPGAGRKPKPIDTVGKNMNAKELAIRRDLEYYFKNGTALKAPKNLGDVAFNKWNEIMASYTQQGVNVLNILDFTQLTLYVQSYERYEKAHSTWTNLLKQNIAVTDQVTDKLIKRCLKIMQDETAIMARLAPDLLLTPTGRAKFGIGAAKAAETERDEGKAAFAAFVASIGGGDN